MYVLNRWVRGPDAAVPEGGAGSETWPGSSLKEDGGRRKAALPWLRQWRVDAAGDTGPEVWSDLGSSVEPDESEEVNRDKQTAIRVVFLSSSLSKKPEKDKESLIIYLANRAVTVSAKLKFQIYPPL